MNTFVLKLQSKIKLLRATYEKEVSARDQTSFDFEDNENKMFSSMQRWHDNSHMSNNDWNELFQKIKSRLTTRNNFKCCDSETLSVLEYVKARYSSAPLYAQFSVSELFSEEFESSVKSYYLDLIDESKAVDEFDLTYLKE